MLSVEKHKAVEILAKKSTQIVKSTIKIHTKSDL